jgi:hypothetical protein
MRSMAEVGVERPRVPGSPTQGAPLYPRLLAGRVGFFLASKFLRELSSRTPARSRFIAQVEEHGRNDDQSIPR